MGLLQQTADGVTVTIIHIIVIILAAIINDDTIIVIRVDVFDDDILNSILIAAPVLK